MVNSQLIEGQSILFPTSMANPFIPDRRGSLSLSDRARKILGLEDSASRRGSLPAANSATHGQQDSTISMVSTGDVVLPNKARKILGLPETTNESSASTTNQRPRPTQIPVAERRYSKKNLFKKEKLRKWLSNLHLTPEDGNNITESQPGDSQAGVPAIVIDCYSNDLEDALDRTTRRSVSIDEGLLSPFYTLDAAVARGDSKLLETILCSGGVKLNTTNASGGTAMHEAAFQGKIKCLRVFLRFGVNINLRDKEGWTPLHAAVCGGDLKCVAFLLRHGAKADALTQDGIKPVQIALQAGDRRLVQIISSANADKGVRLETSQRKNDRKERPEQNKWGTSNGDGQRKYEEILQPRIHKNTRNKTHDIRETRNESQALSSRSHFVYN